ncbi:hypothetical protein HK101_008864, partial [Irineochytrium annulatum]
SWIVPGNESIYFYQPYIPAANTVRVFRDPNNNARVTAQADPCVKDQTPVLEMTGDYTLLADGVTGLFILPTSAKLANQGALFVVVTDGKRCVYQDDEYAPTTVTVLPQPIKPSTTVVIPSSTTSAASTNSIDGNSISHSASVTPISPSGGPSAPKAVETSSAATLPGSSSEADAVTNGPSPIFVILVTVASAIVLVAAITYLLFRLRRSALRRKQLSIPDDPPPAAHPEMAAAAASNPSVEFMVASFPPLLDGADSSSRSSDDMYPDGAPTSASASVHSSSSSSSSQAPSPFADPLPPSRRAPMAPLMTPKDAELFSACFRRELQSPSSTLSRSSKNGGRTPSSKASSRFSFAGMFERQAGEGTERDGGETASQFGPFSDEAKI